ncbi:Na+/H+ antiporter subunit E [Wenzhouxiangella limi]|uniref:Na+/H+ antiporter subunit E n=1 Tax=Wenzhouxiangella limi TaxID=2707351 RepID=A0A845UQR1_9GAMM|nr:Na+/H+ antiporter subunit E [Wenzhouxiangella limi]NDY94173.1 Na+/H+ antiporter subunit E [Wenzhouxiangella limi]
MRWIRLTAAGFLFWLILTAGLGWWPGLLGLVLAGLVAAISLHYLGSQTRLETGETLGLLVYALALIPMVIPAAWQVLRLVLSREMAIAPEVIKYRTSLRRPLARAALANSITLTPGTHCVDLEGDLLTIHCLKARFATPITDRILERRLARLLERTA